MTAQHPIFDRNAIPGASPYVLALREELRGKRMRVIGRFEIAGRAVTVALGHDSLWAITRRDEARLAIRAAFAPGGFKARRMRARKGEALRVGLTSAMGEHIVTFRIATDELPVL